MLPHATAMLQQPRLPPSGEQQATEIEIKWREVLRNKKTSLELLSKHTGQPVDKLERDMDRPYYMTPEKARDYGVIDRVLERYSLLFESLLRVMVQLVNPLLSLRQDRQSYWLREERRAV